MFLKGVAPQLRQGEAKPGLVGKGLPLRPQAALPELAAVLHSLSKVLPGALLEVKWNTVFPSILLPVSCQALIRNTASGRVCESQGAYPLVAFYVLPEEN